MAKKNISGPLTFKDRDQEKLLNYVHIIIEEYKTAINEDDESMLDEIDIKMSNMELTFNQLISLSPIQTMIFCNHNEAMSMYFPREKSTRTKLFNHLKKVNLQDDFEKEEMVNFLMWTGQLWTDEEFSKLLVKFCNSLTKDNKSLLIRLRNLVRDFVHFDKTMEIIEKTSTKLNIRYVDEQIAKKSTSKKILDELFEEDVNKI